jgi:hypothetical protein
MERLRLLGIDGAKSSMILAVLPIIGGIEQNPAPVVEEENTI